MTFLPGFVPDEASVLWTTLLFGAIFIVADGALLGALLGLAGQVTRG